MGYVHLHINSGENEVPRKGFIFLPLIFMIGFPAFSDDLWRFSKSGEVFCEEAETLSQDEQIGLLQIQGEYTLFFLGGVNRPNQFTLKIDTPGAFDGTSFPKNICASSASIIGYKDEVITGLAEYRIVNPDAEHRGFEYQALFGFMDMIIKVNFSQYEGGRYIAGFLFDPAHENPIQIIGWRD